MPANPNPLAHYGWKISVEDKRWWRRGQRMRLPFYNNYFYTTFSVYIEHEDPSQGEQFNDEGTFRLQFLFSDGGTREALEVPYGELKQIPPGHGNRRRYSTIPTLFHPTGETSIAYGHYRYQSSTEYEDLFSFHVGKESTILGSIATGFIGLILLGTSLGGAVIGARCQPEPVDVVGPVAVVTATPEPTETATPVAATAKPSRDTPTP